MRALVPAVVASLALHAAAYAAIAWPRAEAKPAATVRSPATVDVEVALSGRVATAPREAAARFEPAPRVKSHRLARRATANATPTATATTTSNATPNPTATPTANATPTPDASPTPPSDLDLSAFFGRLQRAAQRCSGPRPGEGKIRFCVAANGDPTDVALVQSTGNFALDDAALHCVIPGAAPFPRTDRCLVVPLAFH